MTQTKTHKNDAGVEEYWYVDPTTLEWVGPFTSEEEAEKFREEDYEKYLEE